MLPRVDANSYINVLILEDHKIICAGLTLLIENAPTVRVVSKSQSESSNGREVNIIILSSGAELPEHSDIKRIRRRYPSARIILFLKSKVVSGLKDLVKIGISGVVHRAHRPEMLVRAIEKVNSGQVWFARSLIGEVINDLTDEDRLQRKAIEQQKIKSLTKRELEVIGLIGEGLQNKEICERIFVSEATVRSHMNSIFCKLNVKDRLSLVIYAYKHRLLTVSED